MSSASRASCIDPVVTSDTSGSYEARSGILRWVALGGHPPYVEDEEQGVYRGEVTSIMWKLADIDVTVRKILAYIEGDEDEWEQEEEEDHPPDA